MESSKRKGTFIVSLDFELLWGVHDLETRDSFREHIIGARKAVDRMLKMFEAYEIHATWGVVGMLMADNKREIVQYSPCEKPLYDNEKLSTYYYLDLVGENEAEDNAHYATSLISHICDQPNQELASHTYSHYYCKEAGQTKETFAADLLAARKIARDKFGVELKSLILPRNQFTEDYAEIIKQTGFVAVRGNPESIAYHGRKLLPRALRLIDTYIGVCGRKSYKLETVGKDIPVNIKASSFFRKYNRKLGFLEWAKVAHIKREMRYAARNGRAYHLWWHPHNISMDQEKCFAQLTQIFDYYKKLQSKYGFESKNMHEAAEVLINEDCNAV